MGGSASRGLHSGVREVCIQRGVVRLPLGTRKVDSSHPTGMFSRFLLFLFASTSVVDPGFSRRGGALTQNVGAPSYMLAIFPQKLHEIEKKIGTSSAPALDPPTQVT